MVPRGSAVELSMLVAMLLVALVSGSVALLGETLRSALLAAALVWAVMVRVTAARDAGRRYQFGVGKLDQAGNACIGLALAAAGLWLTSRAFNQIVVGESEAGPVGFAVAATVNAVHSVRRGFLLWPHATFRVTKWGPADRLPPRALAFSLVPLLIVQAALTVAALAGDPSIAMAADCAGGIFISLLMTVAGIRMIWQAVPDLIDHPLRSEDEAAIRGLLYEQGVHANELVALRSRRSGRDLFVELTLDPVEVGSFEGTCRRLARLRHILDGRLVGLDLSIRLSRPPT